MWDDFKQTLLEDQPTAHESSRFNLPWIGCDEPSVYVTIV
jgi:hypothetical protein